MIDELFHCLRALVRERWFTPLVIFLCGFLRKTDVKIQYFHVSGAQNNDFKTSEGKRSYAEQRLPCVGIFPVTCVD